VGNSNAKHETVWRVCSADAECAGAFPKCCAKQNGNMTIGLCTTACQ
jgi:hypothetical protein